MLIVILNWRCIKNPKEGGAERTTFEYAKYWLSKGHKVVWVANRYKNSKKFETIEGVSFIRVGFNLNTHLFWFILRYPFYLFSVWRILLTKYWLNHDVKLIVDEIHGFPHFASLLKNKRVVLLTCEVAGSEIWSKMFPFPFNILGVQLEKFIYRFYKNNEIWTISQSTTKDVKQLNPALNVKILPLGISTLQKSNPVGVTKNSYPTALFVARVVKMKGVEDAIKAAQIICKKFPNFVLNIVGGGEDSYILSLKKLAVDLNISKNVNFLGYVSEKKKYSLYRQSHFLFHPSFKEGFGLTVLEAGLVKTPSIVRGGSSLDELVKDNKNGFVVNNYREMATKFINSINNKKVYNHLCLEAYKNANNYLWPKVLQKSKRREN